MYGNNDINRNKKWSKCRSDDRVRFALNISCFSYKLKSIPRVEKAIPLFLFRFFSPRLWLLSLS